jgi:hypothetical protein
MIKKSVLRLFLIDKYVAENVCDQRLWLLEMAWQHQLLCAPP